MSPQEHPTPVRAVTNGPESSAALIAKLKGQVMHVPDMLTLFPTCWPSGGRNKYYKRLKVRFDEIIEAVFPDEATKKRAYRNDFAFFTSVWFPDADWDQLYTCGLFSFWLFHCDDAMDESFGSVSQDLATSTQYRKQVLDYTRWCLGLGPPAPTGILSKLTSWFWPAPKWNPPAPNLPNTVFKEFGERVQATTSRTFREMFYAEIKQYIDHCEIEQTDRLSGEISDDLESYMQVRHHTSAVRAYGYITQLGTGMRLPIWMTKSPEMQRLWDEMTLLIIIANDILSAKKELAGGCVHNAVPVMYHQGQPLDKVIDALLNRLDACRKVFDETADKVASSASRKGVNELRRYIDGLRTNVTGTVEFCKLAQRYHNESYFNADGTMDVVL
ncbi:isoprenoid synthase domain-containing protein [Cercophora newfieldiana]|uniref:Terpene synthase n=1 Tax=Cercophora newfieldiana TaxID=92897 RepID=A0AA39Y7H3_9PEZI|nr:isoprenoid synthase domain-containing protein [Cercophora newfieldiana]